MMKGGEIKPCRTRLFLPMIQAQKNETAALGGLKSPGGSFFAAKEEGIKYLLTWRCEITYTMDDLILLWKTDKFCEKNEEGFV